MNSHYKGRTKRYRLVSLVLEQIKTFFFSPINKGQFKMKLSQCISKDLRQKIQGEPRRQNKVLPLKYCIIILKSNRLQSPLNTAMKQNNAKSIPAKKIAQLSSRRNQSKSATIVTPFLSVQDLKSTNNDSQLLFKGNSKANKQKPKEALNNHILQNQLLNANEGAFSSQHTKKPQTFVQKFTVGQQALFNQPQGQIRILQKDRRESKAVKEQPTGRLAQLQERSSPIEHAVEKRSKKDAKAAKRLEKQKQWQGSAEREIGQISERSFEREKSSISNQLLQLFKQKYGYYLIDNKVIYPIQDSLFLRYPQLLSQKNNFERDIQQIMRPLPFSFSKELQIWNMIIQYPAFFELDDEITTQKVASMLKDQNSPDFRKIFKNLHKFYINDIIFQRYDQSSAEEYYSFISLWRYAEENIFLDKLFHTSWNKFLLFYISIQKPHYSDSKIIEQLEYFQNKISADIQNGNFYPPSNYSKLLDYLVFLINMCFETHTFKSLINNKMLFFRDNNKTKNQLLEQKKNIQNQLWELKENQKKVIKKEKALQKQYKKEQKNSSNMKSEEIQAETNAISEEKIQLSLQRERLQQKVIQIDNKIYELCCLPEFSNVWLLGEDRNKNLYWFIREQQNIIYRQSSTDHSWAAIQFESIDKLQLLLNMKGIREHKLHEKILYYKQLGYINTQKSKEHLELKQQTLQHMDVQIQANEMQSSSHGYQKIDMLYDINEFDKFNYMEYKNVSPHIIRMMILKSEWMMSRYLFERNSKWTSEQTRQEYITRMTNHPLTTFDSLTQDLRTFNEKICVVQINIKIAGENQNIENKTRKIQTKIWGINEKYKHFWYDYSKRCKNLSDLHFLVSILYLTIEKYVTKTRKPNNTKYFFKTVDLDDNNEMHDVGEHFGEQDLG